MPRLAAKPPKVVNSVYAVVRSVQLPAASVATFRVGEESPPDADYVRAVVPGDCDVEVEAGELERARRRAKAVKVIREPKRVLVPEPAVDARSSARALTLREQVMQRCPEDAALRDCVNEALGEVGL